MACQDLPFHRVVVDICLGSSIVRCIALQSKRVMNIIVECIIGPVSSSRGVILPSSCVPRWLTVVIRAGITTTATTGSAIT